MIILHEIGWQTHGPKLIGAKGLHEKSSSISENSRCNNYYVIQMNGFDRKGHGFIVDGPPVTPAALVSLNYNIFRAAAGRSWP